MQKGLKSAIHKARQQLKQFGGQALSLILPRNCASCGRTNETFCESCKADSYKNGAQCLICGFRNNDGRFCAECAPGNIKRVLWAGRYDGALKEAIWQFKYQKRKELARPLAEMLWKKFLEKCSPQADYVIVPIPLHFKKEHERGFNQAELLAKEFSKLSNFPLLTRSLLKIKETPAQVAVENKELRIKNLEGAFEVRSNNPPKPPYFKGGTIILIDDVSTTGATLIHASRALANTGLPASKAGAKNIIGLVVAHGG